MTVPTSSTFSKAQPAAEARYLMLVTLPLKQEEFDDFLEVLRENALKARLRPGNISFDVYQRESGGDDLFVFERWSDMAALDAHKQTHHRLAVAARLPADLRAPLSQLVLEELSPPVTPARPAAPALTRNVLATLHVRPEERDALVTRLLDTVAPSRAAVGNLGWDLFRDKADPNTLFLMERWESIAAHEAHLAQPYNDPVKRILDASLAQPLGQKYVLAADVVSEHA